jgi:hypothetical protein
MIEEAMEPTTWLLITGWIPCLSSVRSWRNHDALPPRPVAGDFDDELDNLDPVDVQ